MSSTTRPSSGSLAKGRPAGCSVTRSLACFIVGLIIATTGGDWQHRPLYRVRFTFRRNAKRPHSRENAMIENSTPILVGCGDVTDMTTPVEQGRSPFDLIAQAGQIALNDTGAAAKVAKAIDTVAMMRLFSDTSHRFATKLGTSSNPPKSIAQRLGIDARRQIYSWNGGNMPQYLVNSFAEQIARGEIKAALIC